MFHRITALALGALFLVLGLNLAYAQDEAVQMLSLNGFSFGVEPAFARNINIEHYAGDDPQNGPGFADAPHTAITLYNNLGLPERVFDTEAGIRLYRMADLAPYEFLIREADALRSLLDERPDLALFEIVSENGLADRLPYIPVLPHGQILNARVDYLETDAIEGIRYITYSNAAMEPFMSNMFTYTFQGLSTDGQYYVTVNLPLETSLFPSEPQPIDPEAFAQQWTQYLEESINTLDSAAPGDFSPSLDWLDTLIQSFAFDEA